MPLPEFFDKSALAAAQVLDGVTHDSLARFLEETVVAVSFDDAAASSPEGRVTLDLTVNLLARLYPRLALVPAGAPAERLRDTLVATAQGINPRIEIGAPIGEAAVVVVVGNTAADVTAPTLYVGSDGWLAKFSPRAPVGSGASGNPFGAAGAACFGAANLFRRLFGGHLENGAVDAPFTLSLLDYCPDAVSAADPDLPPIRLGATHLVGVGAIGNAAVWTLARVPGLTGDLHLIDGETVDDGNLQRYVLAAVGDVGVPKVAVAHRVLENTDLTVHVHQEQWGEFLRGHDTWRLPVVAVAVDSAADRQAIQAALPQWIANAWTQEGDIGVSRHAFLGDQACLMCLYLPDAAQPSEDQIIAEAIGLPDELMEVRRLLFTGEPITRELLGRVAAARNVPVEPLHIFEGQPLRSLYTGAICGGLMLRLGAAETGAANRATVPLAFQSALAGIMLAAEIVAHAGSVRGDRPPTTTRIDLLRPLGQYLSLDAAKHPSGRCICQDADYISTYGAKYPTG